MGSSKSKMLRKAVEDTYSVRKFIESKYDINLQDGLGNTALIYACWNSCFGGNINVVKSLLSAGADPNIQNKDGSTALMYVVGRSNWRNVKTVYLIEVIRVLISSGANPNIQNRAGQTALMFSINIADINIAKELLSLGANPDLQSYVGGYTALMMTAHHINEYRTRTLVEMLISAGANLDIQDPLNYKSALMTFITNGRNHNCTKDIVTMLISAGARLDLTSFDGWTGEQLVMTYFPTIALSFGIGTPLVGVRVPPPGGKLFISKECLICTETPPELSLEPCGHIAVCRDCYSMFQEQVCPLCRGAITSTRQVVFS